MSLLWLLLRVRWRRAFAPALAVALLIGAIGGFVLAAAIAAQRVENAYRTFAVEIDVPDIATIPEVACGPVNGTGCGRPIDGPTAEEVLADLNSLEVVEQTRLVTSVIPYITDRAGTPIFGTVDNPNACFDSENAMQMVASESGGPTEQVVPFVLEGEMPRPGSATIVFTRGSASSVGLAIGDSVFLAGRCTGDGDPIEFVYPIKLRISGLSIGPLDIEPPGIGLTIHPAFVDPLVFQTVITHGAETSQNVTVWFDPSASPDAISEAMAPYTIILDFHERQLVIDDALQTDAELLWLLTAIGAMAGLLVLAPVIGRNLRDTGPDVETLAALGVRQPQISQQALAYAGSLAVIGGLSAAVLAIPFSAFMPSGLATTIQPSREFSLDGFSTGIGIVVIIVVVVLLGAIPARRLARFERSLAGESSRPNGLVPLFGFRPAVRTGVSAAIGAPAGPRRANPWPSLLSLVIAGIVGVASVTYLAGLRHLERSPAVVGWNWDAAVGFEFIESDPDSSREAIDAIAKLDVVEEMTEGTFYPPWFLYAPDSDLTVWPWSFATGADAITPSMLSGRAPEGPDEVAVNPFFAEQTGLGVGDSVVFARATLIAFIAENLQYKIEEYGLNDLELPVIPDEAPTTAEFEITGIALLPNGQELAQVSLTLEGYSTLVEPSAAEVAAGRAWLPDDLPPEFVAEMDEFFANLEISGRMVYLRFNGSVYDGANAVAQVDGVVDEDGNADITAPTPEQVMNLMLGLNLQHSERIPNALAIMVAVAFFAIAVYLLAFSIRSRRYEMAVMRALGLSTRGIRWSVVAQATATAVVALAIAIPVGVLVGRWAWLEYARDLEVQPVAVMPWSQLALVALGAIVVANAVALVPGWFAARRLAGADLRAE